MFVHYYSDLLRCHFSEEIMYEVWIVVVLVFMDQRNPFGLFSFQITGQVLYFELVGSRDIFVKWLFVFYHASQRYLPK